MEGIFLGVGYERGIVHAQNYYSMHVQYPF
jgi:hypothetical protein